MITSCQNMSGNIVFWTKIKPEQFEAIGFVDDYDEDKQGNPNGELSLWKFNNPPQHIKVLTARYLAFVWEIFCCSEKYGDEYFEIRTESEFNEVMKHLNLVLKL